MAGAVALSHDAHLSDDEAGVKMGHPDVESVSCGPPAETESSRFMFSVLILAGGRAAIMSILVMGVNRAGIPPTMRSSVLSATIRGSRRRRVVRPWLCASICGHAIGRAH